MTSQGFRERMSRRITLLDGGFGSMLIAAGLEPGRAPDWWTLASIWPPCSWVTRRAAARPTAAATPPGRSTQARSNSRASWPGGSAWRACTRSETEPLTAVVDFLNRVPATNR